MMFSTVYKFQFLSIVDKVSRKTELLSKSETHQPHCNIKHLKIQTQQMNINSTNFWNTQVCIQCILSNKNLSILCIKTLLSAVYQHTKHPLPKRQHWEWKMTKNCRNQTRQTDCLNQVFLPTTLKSKWFKSIHIFNSHKVKQCSIMHILKMKTEKELTGD